MKVPGSKSGSSAPTGPGTLAHARTLWPGPGLPRATLVLADLGPGDGPRHPAPGCPDARRHPLRKSARPPHTAYCPGARRSARRTVCAPHGARAAGDVTACASVSPALISEGPGVSSLLWHKSHSHRTWDPEKGGEAAGSSRRGHTNAAGAVGPRTWPAPQQGKQKAVQGEGGPAGRAGGTGAQLSPWGPHTSHLQPRAGLGKLEAIDPGACAFGYKCCCGASLGGEGSFVCIARSQLGRGRCEPHRRQERSSGSGARRPRRAPPSASTRRAATRGCAPRTTLSAAAAPAWPSPPAHPVTASLSGLRATQNSTR